jgi:hypothetical protein
MNEPRSVPTWRTRVFVTLGVLSGVVGLAVVESLSEPHMSPTVRFLLRLFQIIARPPYSNLGPAMPPLNGEF